jgi:hypothetical protein
MFMLITLPVLDNCGSSPDVKPSCQPWRRSSEPTGDALFIRGCGRTDFQDGDAGALYDSVTQHLFSLPDNTLVYPGHDYKGCTVSTIGEEKRWNPRFAGRDRMGFIQLMNSLNLPQPEKISVAVPANRRCGLGPLDFAEPQAMAWSA